MNDQLVQLERLQVELHAANRELAQAARPLKQLSKLNNDQRQKVADHLQAWLARWDSVTHDIQQVMGTGNANSQVTSQGNEGGSR